MLNRLEHGDVLIVTKLDRLGRNAIDMRSTVEQLEKLGVRVHYLALGGADLTSAADKMTMQVISAVAEFERDLLIERTQSRLKRAKAAGKHCGRPPALSEAERAAVIARLDGGASVASLAKEFNTSRSTIMHIRDSRPIPATRKPEPEVLDVY
ncbi:recombinase family protein [Burkholderia cenocepacia]|nr:recombinase family protein [Burkholderia cenocepacia]